MITFTNYRHTISAAKGVSLMRPEDPANPPFAVILASGELLDTFDKETDAWEFFEIAADMVQAGLPDFDPDAPAVRAALKLDGTEALLRCGCRIGECCCSQYPSWDQWQAMQAEAEKDLPIPEPLTDADWIGLEELRNFHGNPHLDN